MGGEKRGRERSASPFLARGKRNGPRPGTWTVSHSCTASTASGEADRLQFFQVKTVRVPFSLSCTMSLFPPHMAFT